MNSKRNCEILSEKFFIGL